jgi:hypothetical protein
MYQILEIILQCWVCKLYISFLWTHECFNYSCHLLEGFLLLDLKHDGTYSSFLKSKSELYNFIIMMGNNSTFLPTPSLILCSKHVYLAQRPVHPCSFLLLNLPEIRNLIVQKRLFLRTCFIITCLSKNCLKIHVS